MFRVSAKLAVKTIHGRIVLTMRQRRRCAVYFQKDAFKKNFRKLLQRDGIDARSVQKTPAGTPKTEHPCSILGYKFAGANLILLETADISVRSDTLSIYFVQHEVDAHLQRFCKETVQIQGASKNKAETYLLYVEHLFLRSNAVDAPYICKRLVDTKKLTLLIRREKAFLAAVFELYGNHQFAAALP